MMMKILFLFLAFSFQLFARAQVRTKVILASEIELANKSEINIYDLAKIEKSSSEVLKKLSEIKIDSEFIKNKFLTYGITSSSEKIYFTMTREEMLKIIRKKNSDHMNLQWVIPDLVKVELRNQVNKAEIERKIDNHLQALCAECTFEINIDKLPSAKSTNWDISVSDVSLKSSYLIAAKTDEKTFWISIRQKVFKEVPVTTRWIPALQKIQPGDLELKRADIANSKDGFLNLSQMTNSILVRSMPVGSIVGASDIKREAVIKRGQVLKAQIENSDFEISISATAEESGFIGDVIKIKANDKQMSGKIKDNGSVVVL